MDDHLRAISRVYGAETWEVYDLLDRSLEPRGPEVMSLASARLTQASLADTRRVCASSHTTVVATKRASRGGTLHTRPSPSIFVCSLKGS